MKQALQRKGPAAFVARGAVAHPVGRFGKIVAKRLKLGAKPLFYFSGDGITCRASTFAVDDERFASFFPNAIAPVFLGRWGGLKGVWHSAHDLIRLLNN